LKTKSLLSNARDFAWALSLSLAACSPPAHWIAVASEDTQAIKLFKSDLSLDHEIPLAARDFGDARILTAVFARDGASFYVADSRPSGSYLSLIRRSDGRVLVRRELTPGLTPRTLTPTPDARTLIVTASPVPGTGAAAILLLSADSLDERSRIEPCEGYAETMALLPDMHRGYTRCHDGGKATVVEVDLALGRLVRAVDLDQGASLAPATSQCGPGGIALSTSGNILLIPCSASGMLLYLDRMTLKVLDSMPVGRGAHQIAVSPRRPVALVTSPDSSAVVLIDLARRSVMARIATPGSASAVAVSGDGKIGYVLLPGVDSKPGTLIRLDIRARTILNTVTVDPGMRSLTVWPGSWSPAMWWR
jgi:hypothetical protein